MQDKFELFLGVIILLNFLIPHAQAECNINHFAETDTIIKAGQFLSKTFDIYGAPDEPKNFCFASVRVTRSIGTDIFPYTSLRESRISISFTATIPGKYSIKVHPLECGQIFQQNASNRESAFSLGSWSRTRIIEYVADQFTFANMYISWYGWLHFQSTSMFIEISTNSKSGKPWISLDGVVVIDCLNRRCLDPSQQQFSYPSIYGKSVKVQIGFQVDSVNFDSAYFKLSWNSMNSDGGAFNFSSVCLSTTEISDKVWTVVVQSSTACAATSYIEALSATIASAGSQIAVRYQMRDAYSNNVEDLSIENSVVLWLQYTGSIGSDGPKSIQSGGTMSTVIVPNYSGIAICRVCLIGSSGLHATYYSREVPSTICFAAGIQATIDFSRGSNEVSDSVKCPFLARWQGFLIASASSVHTFILSTLTSSNSQLYMIIDGLFELNSWSSFPSVSSISGTFNMIQNNIYSVQIQYECFSSHSATDFLVKFEWVYLNFPKEVVPSLNLKPSWEFNNSDGTSNQFQVSVQSNTVCATTSNCFGSGLTIGTSGSKLQFSLKIYDEYGKFPSNVIEPVMGTAKRKESDLTHLMDVEMLALNSWTFSWIPTISGQYNIAITADSKPLCNFPYSILFVQPGQISSVASSVTVYSSIINAGDNAEFQIMTRDIYGNKALTPDCSNLMNIGFVFFPNGNDGRANAASSSVSIFDSSQVSLKSSMMSAAGIHRLDIVIAMSLIGSFEIRVVPSNRLVISSADNMPTKGLIGEMISLYYSCCLDEFGNSVSDAVIFANAVGPTTVYPNVIQAICHTSTSSQVNFRFNRIGTYSIFTKTAVGTGFMATYYSSVSLSSAFVSRTCSIPAILRAAGEREYPLTQLDTDDGYSVRWKGFLRKYIAGVFTLAIQVAHSDSERITLFVDNIQILNSSNHLETKIYSATLKFEDASSYHEVILEYIRGAQIGGVNHSSLLAFGSLDSVSNFVGIQADANFDIRYSNDDVSFGVVSEIVISSKNSTPSGYSDVETFPVFLSNVTASSSIIFKISPKDMFNAALTTCASSIVLIRQNGVLEIVPITQILDQSIIKCIGTLSSSNTSGTFQLQMFATNSYAGATYYHDTFFNSPAKSLLLLNPSLRWDDALNLNVPGPIPFKMTWMDQTNSSCIISIRCSMLISMSLNLQSVFPRAISNLGQISRTGQQYLWRPSFEQDSTVYFELFGLFEPEEIVLVQQVCHRHPTHSWGAVQHLVLISSLNIAVIADVTSISNCEVTAFSDVLNLFVPVREAVMRVACQKDKYGNIQNLKTLIIGTHFHKISSIGSEFGEGSSTRLQSFSQNVWILSFESERPGFFGALCGVLGEGSLAATFYDSEKNQYQTGALNASTWSRSLLSSLNLDGAPASMLMTFGGFVSMQNRVTRIFNVSIGGTGSASFSLWIDGILSMNTTLPAGSSATGSYTGTNFSRETTMTGESLIPLLLTCTTTKTDTILTLLWNVDGIFMQIPTSNMFSITYKIPTPNLLKTFEAKAHPQNAIVSCSTSGTGLSMMTAGMFSTFSIFCQDGFGKLLNPSIFSSQIRCSLLNLSPSLQAFYSSPCIMKRKDSSLMISLSPSSMHQKIMLSVWGVEGFWATYYSSTNWTNPIAARAELSIDFSHLAGAAPFATLNSGYSIRWRGFCLMPSSGPLTMSFSKTAGIYSLMTDGRALLSSQVTSVQMELLYYLSMNSNTIDNMVKLEWVGVNTVTSKVASSLKIVLEYGKTHYDNSQQVIVFPGLCSLNTSFTNGSTFATIGSHQSIGLTLKDQFQNACSLSTFAIAAYASGLRFQVPLFEKMSELNVIWPNADLYSVNLALGKSRSGPEMLLFRDAACSSLINKLILPIVDFDLNSLDMDTRCLRIEGLLDLPTASSYSVRAQILTFQSPTRSELPCSINLTIWGVGSNLSRDDASTSSVLSTIFFTTNMPAFVRFSLTYTHAQNCNRIKLMLASSVDHISSLRWVNVDASNSGMFIESRTNVMRVLVVANSVVSKINIEHLMLPFESHQTAGNFTFESFTFSCRDENKFGSLCNADELYASACSKQRGRRCNQPTTASDVQSFQAAAFKSFITVASAYKQSLAIMTGFGLWATFYEDAYLSSPFVSFVEPNVMLQAIKLDSSSLFPLNNSVGLSAKWAGFMRSNSDLVTTISSASLPQSDYLTVWIDNSLVIDQRYTSGSQSGTIFLQSNTLFDIEVEYQHFGMGLANMEITYSTAALFFAFQDDSLTSSLNVKADISATCQLIDTNALITIVTFGIPVLFSLACEDQFHNSISTATVVNVLIISEDNPTTNPSYSQNSSVTNSLVFISSVVFCCVSKFFFRIGVDDAIFSSPSFETRSLPPAEYNTLIIGPTIITSGFASLFTIFPRDLFNSSTTYGYLYTSHMSISDANFSTSNQSRYSVGSVNSTVSGAQMLFVTSFLSHGPLLIHHQICKSGYLVSVFSSDQPTKASFIYQFSLSTIKDLNLPL